MKRFIFAASALILYTACSFGRQPEKGYRGFAEWSNRFARHVNACWEGMCWNYTEYYTGISTSHGYQFNPWLFVGAGIDFEVNHKGIPHCIFSDYTLSLFLEGRTDLKFGKYTPFADVRIGHNANASENGNLYFSPSIGYRFNWGRKIGLNVSIGYTLDRSKYQDYILGTTPEGMSIYVPTGVYHQYNRSYLNFRLGIDF